MLAVKKISVSWRFFGEEYNCTTDVFVRGSSFWPSCIQEKQIMSYMIEVQRWIQKYFRTETLDECRREGIIDSKRIRLDKEQAQDQE